MNVGLVMGGLAVGVVVGLKPFGGTVHAMRRTVSWSLVGWLALSSVPSGFASVLVLRVLGGASNVDVVVTTALGAWMGARKWNGLVPSPFVAKHTTRWAKQARRSAAV